MATDTSLDSGRTLSQADDPLAGAPGWDRRLRKAALLVARLGLAYLFFAQLFWKLPPQFGCPPDFRIGGEGPNGGLVRSSGLCDFIGAESYYATKDRSLFGIHLWGDSQNDIELPIGWAARANGWFIDNIVRPNIQVFGWAIWLSEAFIALSLGLGLLTRLGALVSLAVSLHLTIGLAGIPEPKEWQYSYLLMVWLSLVLLALPPGRFLGIDAALRRWARSAADKGSRLGRLVLTLT